MSRTEQIELQELRQRLAESEDTLRAIRSGEVDAVVVSGPKGEQVYALKGAEQPYRVFLETMHEGAATLLADGTIAYSNRRFAELLATPLERFIGNPLESFAAPDHRNRLRLLIERASGGSAEEEIPFVTGNGAAVWIKLSLCATAGDVPVICAVATDITERKRADELRAYIATIVDSSDDAIIGMDLTGTILSWNSGAERLYGYASREIEGEPISTLCPAERVEEAYGLVEQVGRGESIQHFETERVRKDGRRVPISLSVSPIRDLQGRIEGVSAIAHDISGRKRAEEALKAEQHRLLDVLETLPAMICLLTPDYHVAFANRGFRERFGESRGRPCYEYCFGKRGPCEFCESFQVLQTGQPHHWEVQTPDGSWIEAHDYPFTDMDGSPLILKMDVDITEQRTSKQRLEAASAYHRSLIEASLDPLVTIARDGRITDVNQATENATGRTREELIGRDFSDYFTDPKKARAGYQKVFREESVRDYELEIRHHDGRVTPVRYNASLYRDQAGEVAGVFAAARDVSAVQRAQAELRRAGAYTRSLIEASPDPLVTIALDGKITDVNTATEQATGRTRQELIGTDFCDYFTDPQRAREGYQQAFREGRVHDYELEIRHRGGHLTTVLYNASVYRDETGAVAGVFAAARNITKRKLAEEALARQTAELERSNAELQQFAYVASHDLQEPLRAVASFTKLLGERYQGKLDSDADDFIGFAVDGARRAQRLIQDLLAYSRVGSRAAPFVAADCEAVLGEALANLAAALEESGGAVTHEPLPTVAADATQLGQVFQNLIGNALKFHGAQPPRVHVSAERDGGGWRFSVRDNGIGIESRFADQIFAVFQRLHTSAEYPGTGIGLAITKKIVNRHGGRIWVESQPGQGSTFFFTIPVRKE